MEEKRNVKNEVHVDANGLQLHAFLSLCGVLQAFSNVSL